MLLSDADFSIQNQGPLSMAPKPKPNAFSIFVEERSLQVRHYSKMLIRVKIDKWKMCSAIVELNIFDNKNL